MPKETLKEVSREDLIEIIGSEPGRLFSSSLSSDARTALKAFLRRYHGWSAEAVRGAAIDEMRSAYDQTGQPCLLSERFPQEPSEAAQEPQEPKPIIITQEPKQESNGSGSALIAALRDAIGNSVDREQVKKIFEEQTGGMFQTIQTMIDGIAKPKPQTIKIVIQEPQEPKEIKEHTHEQFARVVRLIGIRQHIFLEGPAGCGKTFLVEQAAKALDLEYASISASEGLSESKLLGWLLPIGDGGKFEYVESDFVRIYENGGVFLIDEMDAADSNTLTVLNQALANGGFFLPSRVGNTYVKRHPDFVCVAAANTFGLGGDQMYVGRNRLDAATLDRFLGGMTSLSYDLELEAELGDPEIVAWALETREVINRNQLRRVMSTRSIIDFSKQKAAGFTMKEIKGAYFLNWSEDEKRKAGRAA